MENILAQALGQVAAKVRAAAEHQGWGRMTPARTGMPASKAEKIHGVATALSEAAAHLGQAMCGDRSLGQHVIDWLDVVDSKAEWLLAPATAREARAASRDARAALRALDSLGDVTVRENDDFVEVAHRSSLRDEMARVDRDALEGRSVGEQRVGDEVTISLELEMETDTHVVVHRSERCFRVVRHVDPDAGCGFADVQAPVGEWDVSPAWASEPHEVIDMAAARART